jgi:hypothetical protein
VAAAVTGLTDPAYNNTNIENIPNMDGFPNGRRLEDDVTRIELQAVSGVVLAAIGLWYDDYNPNANPAQSPVTQDLVNVLTYSTGVDANDKAFKTSFPYVAAPWAGTDICPCDQNPSGRSTVNIRSNFNAGGSLSLNAPEVFATVSPNPFVDNSVVRYHLDETAQVNISLYSADGKLVQVLVNEKLKAGTYTQNWNGADLKTGSYFIQVNKNGAVKQNISLVKAQ